MTLSIANRAVLYGDSVFETIAVSDQKPLLFEAHMNRLSASAKALGIDYQRDALVSEIERIVVKHKESCVLRVTISRGEGGRGYQPKKNMDGTRIVSIHDLPEQLKERQSEGINLGLSSIKLSKQAALAGHKHGNRLEQVLASRELTDEIDELLMLDVDDFVRCGSKSNVFVLMNDEWMTPTLLLSGIAGVMREKIISLMNEQGILISESDELTVNDVENAQAVFVSNSLVGVWPVKQYNGIHFESVKHSRAILELLRQSEAIL